VVRPGRAGTGPGAEIGTAFEAPLAASCGAFRAGDLKTPMDFRLPRRRRQSEKEATWLGSSRTNLEVNSSENDLSMGNFEF